MTDTKRAIGDYVNKKLRSGGGKEISEDANILTSGVVDSLGVLKLVDFIEHEFGTEVPEEDVTVTNFRSIAAIGDYLERKKQGEGS